MENRVLEELTGAGLVGEFLSLQKVNVPKVNSMIMIEGYMPML